MRPSHRSTQTPDQDHGPVRFRHLEFHFDATTPSHAHLATSSSGITLLSVSTSPTDSASWKSPLPVFLESLKLDRGASRHTIQAYGSDLRAWFEKLPTVYAPESVSTVLALWRSQGVSARSLARKLTSLRQYLLFCLRENRGAGLACEDWIIRLPAIRYAGSLPEPLTHADLALLLGHLLTRSEQGDPVALRNHALVLLLYGAGLRVSELVGLKCSQIDWVNSAVRVMGKGSKERIVPLADPSREALRAYVERMGMDASSWVFGSSRTGGRALSRQGVWDILRRMGLEAGVTRAFSPHSLRHAFATHLLSGGMNLRHLQQLLGHASIAATEIYTHVENAQLQEIHRKHHPRG